MPLVPGRADYSTHVKAFVEKRHGLPLGTLIGFFLADEEFDFLREKAADGRLPPGSENSGLFKHLPAETDCHILFVAIS
jgi:hypothetical protein